jgi:hypothetical protein
MAFINKGNSSIKGSFEAVKTRVVIDIKGVNRRNSRQQLIIYKLKSPLVLINNLTSASDYFIKLSL